MDSPLLSSRLETNDIETESQASISPAPPKRQLQVEPQKNPCIYRVPAFITKLNPDDYQPQVVSFGPYHDGKDHLSEMEKHKDLVQERFSRQVESLKPFVDMLPELTKSYDALNPEWEDKGKFLKLLIRDGCFMLEIMRAWAAAIEGENVSDWFKTNWLEYITPYIRRDMLLLENQLPMSLLYQLVALEKNDKAVDEVNELIGKFYFPPEKQQFTGLGPCLHVLDVFRKGLLMGREAGEGDESSVDTGIMGMGHVVDVFRKCLPKKTENVRHNEKSRSATELDKAGIRFDKNEIHSLKEISFAGGVLKLPVIAVDDNFKSKFLNVMTFERLHNGAGTEVTSYVIFMDNIINDEQDVALLHTQGIIQNAIGSNKAVAELFNSLCKEVQLVSNDSLETVQKDISNYCERPWNTWRTNLVRTHCQNPWTILSLTAAIFLFVLAIIQTAYAVLS